VVVVVVVMVVVVVVVVVSVRHLNCATYFGGKVACVGHGRNYEILVVI